MSDTFGPVPGVLLTSESAPFLARLRAEAERGVLIGVRIACVLLVVGLCLGWFIGDYTATKAKAQQGAAAFEFLQRAQQKAEAAK